jgi:hypothetical protein
MNILYVSHSNRTGYLYQDPSVRYRCYSFAEELVCAGNKIDENKYDSQQLLLFPVVSYEQLPYWIKQCWITIAPLQPSLFNQCKSGLKFFESAIWGVPLVATAIPDLTRCDTELCFAEGEQGWLDQLEMMLEDAPYTKISKKN